jgi:hypothetical protein
MTFMSTQLTRKNVGGQRTTPDQCDENRVAVPYLRIPSLRAAASYPGGSNAHFFRIVFIAGGKNMTKRSLLLLGVLAMSILPIASAKSYTIAFTGLTVVGSTQLPAGEYTLKVEGSNAVISSVDNDKSVTVPVKIENADKKYGFTAVETTQKGDARQITDIQLGGSKTKLEFN